MSVYLLDGSVLLNSGSVAASEDCCCQDCTTCDDLPPSGSPPPSHVNIVAEYSGSCGDVDYSGSITYDNDLDFHVEGPIGGHLFCAYDVWANGQGHGDFWTGQFTRTCTLNGATGHWGSSGEGGLIGRDFVTCEWWFQLSTFFLFTGGQGAIGTCAGCFFSYSSIFQSFAPPGDPSGVYVFVLTDMGVTLTITLTIT